MNTQAYEGDQALPREVEANGGVAPRKRKKRSGKGGAEAERLIESWLQVNGWTTHRAAATGMNSAMKGGKKVWFVKSHDLYGCIDILAFKQGGGALSGDPRGSEETWAVQVTTQGKRSPRRRKIEPLAWPSSWRVSIVSHETTPDPAGGNRKLHFARVEDLVMRAWMPHRALPIDPKACEAHRKAAHAAKKARRERDESPKDPVVFDEQRGQNTQ